MKFFKKLALLTICACTSLIFSGCTGGETPKIEMRVQNGYVQYLDENNSWQNLISVEDLKGQDGINGKNVEIRIDQTSGDIQWRQEGGTWQTIVNVSQLYGQDGSTWHSGTTYPSYPKINDYFLNTNQNKIYKYNGTTWIFQTDISGKDGEPGETGNGIKSITIDSANTDETKTTYIITFDNNTTFSFEVKNGTNGLPGELGAPGEAGNGIKSITIDNANTDETKTTYIITFDDNTTFSFVVNNGIDATYSTYIITYDYGAANSYFNNNIATTTIKSTEWLTNLPTIKEEYKDVFKGWYIFGTDKRIEKYDFIGGNVTLEARFDIEKNVEAGLYHDGKFVKTWAELTRGSYPDVEMSSGTITFINNNLDGEIVLGDNVKKLDILSFSKNSKFTAVVISASVTDIYEGLFADNDNLEKLIVREGNNVYDSRENCNAIIETKTQTLISGSKNAHIPNGIKVIGHSSFLRCTLLDEIIIPNGVEIIDSYAFNGCTALKNILIPDSVKQICNQSFSECENLESIFIGGGVSEISADFLQESDKLSKISVSSNNVIFDSRENCNALVKTDSDELIVGCSSSIIPSSIKVIGLNAFELCKNLKSIIIPNGVETIKSYAFKNCASLESIEISASVIKLGNDAFDNCMLLKTVIIDSTNIYNRDCGFLNAYESLVNYATTVKVLKSVVDGEGNSNSSLNSSLYSKTEDGDYYVYTKVVA